MRSRWRWAAGGALAASLVVLVAVLVIGEGTWGRRAAPVAPTLEATALPAPEGAALPPVEAYDPATDPYVTERERMVDATIVARGVSDAEVLRAMNIVPRHRFVLPKDLAYAYEDHPLAIGYGQTISQPYIVAWMTELLALQPGERVLEIGTGSGYQAAVLAELEDVEVYSIEIVPELAEEAAARLEALGYTEVHLRQGDGYFGWEEAAPFDAIIVTAAPDHLPQLLAQQLREGGRLVIPIGPPGGYQSLWRFVNGPEGLQASNLGGVRFVPFTGAGAPAVQPARRPGP